MSFINHPLWPELKPYLRVEKAAKDTKKSRVRIEVLPLPPELRKKALAAWSPCVACAAEMHPIRARKGPNKRKPRPPVHLYFAAACPLNEDFGCSRGAAARDEYNAIAKALKKGKP